MGMVIYIHYILDLQVFDKELICPERSSIIYNNNCILAIPSRVRAENLVDRSSTKLPRWALLLHEQPLHRACAFAAGQMLLKSLSSELIH